MVTQNNEGEAEVLEEQSVDAESEAEETLAEEQETEEPPDYEALYRKAQNDLDSLRGQDRRRTRDEDRWNDLTDRIKSQESLIAKALAAMATGDTEQVVQEIAREQQTSHANQQNRAFMEAHARVLQELEETVFVDGNRDEQRVSQADMDKLVSMWDDASKQYQETRDPGHLYRVRLEAERMIMAEERKAHAAALKKEQEAAKRREKQALEKAGVHDHDLGPALGGGSEPITNREKLAREIERRGGKITTI
jgi:hypothetical protein